MSSKQTKHHACLRRQTSVQFALFLFSTASLLFVHLSCVHEKKWVREIPAIEVPSTPAHHTSAQDSTPKEEPRLMSAEAYIRSYLQLFGGLAPTDAQKKAKGRDGNNVFDTWEEYLAALGLPDYRADIPRGTQSNALMVATFERLGNALCDRAVEYDLMANPARAVHERLIFAFDDTDSPPQGINFFERLDVLHRTFLGYPLKLAPTSRSERLLQLFTETIERHKKLGAKKTRFTPIQAAWAVVCYTMIRHPEFHLY